MSILLTIVSDGIFIQKLYLKPFGFLLFLRQKCELIHLSHLADILIQIHLQLTKYAAQALAEGPNGSSSLAVLRCEPSHHPLDSCPMP